MKRKGTKDLSYTQRVQLEAYLNAGLHKKQIAENLGVCRSEEHTSELQSLKRISYAVSLIGRAHV